MNRFVLDHDVAERAETQLGAHQIDREGGRFDPIGVLKDRRQLALLFLETGPSVLVLTQMVLMV